MAVIVTLKLHCPVLITVDLSSSFESNLPLTRLKSAMNSSSSGNEYSWRPRFSVYWMGYFDLGGKGKIEEGVSHDGAVKRH